MKTISVSVSIEDYEEFRRIAKSEHRSIAQLIREAMAIYRQMMVDNRPALRNLPVLVGHKPIEQLPNRSELYDEIFAETP